MMKQKWYRTAISALLGFAMLFSSAQAATISLDRTVHTAGTIAGDAMMALNMNLNTADKQSEKFEIQSSAQTDLPEEEAREETMQIGNVAPAGSEISQIIYDEETGTINEMLSVRFEEPECLGKARKLFAAQQGEPFSYQIGETKAIRDGIGEVSRTLECLAVGERCTVWGCIEDAQTAADLMISTANAQAVAENFDNVCGSMVDSFGNWLDADGDGKLAIFCYDIFQDYTKTTGNKFVGGYYGGYTQNSNLYDPVTGKAGNFRFKVSETSYGMDCIHIDTFPTMGDEKDNLFSQVDRSYPTLFHEMQHLIELSYRMTGKKNYYDAMPTFLNEAFSMAAEEILFGPNSSSLVSRVLWFNGVSTSSYIKGSPLTYWDEPKGQPNVVLSNYANSYLFGQYIRTRYAQKTGDPNGNTIFRYILEARHAAEGGDALQMIADLLETTKEDLIRDFWAAVYLREEKGPLGFNGEKWVMNNLRPQVETLTAGTSPVVSNGGCRYYTITDGAVNIKSAGANIRFYSFCDVAPVSIGAIEEDKLKLYVRYRPSGSVCIAVFGKGSKSSGEMTLLQVPTQNGEIFWTSDALQEEEITVKLMSFDENWRPCAEVINVEKK